MLACLDVSSVPFLDDVALLGELSDLGDVMELLDALLGVETLPKVGWIERKKTSFDCIVQSHEKRSRRTILC